jgi:hypothetical protein
MKEIADSSFMEIFGATNAVDSIGGRLLQLWNPDVPDVAVLDDPLHDFRKSAGAADSFCKQLESDALTAELIGPCFDAAGEILSPSAQKTIGGNPHQPEPDLSGLFDNVHIDFGKFAQDVGKYYDRGAALAKKEPRRRRELREIVDSTLGQFVVDHAPNRLEIPELKRDIDTCFGRITDNMYALTHQMLMEVEA